MTGDASLNCVRCDSPLTFLGERDLHEGSRGWGFFLGDLGELLVNREKVEMYVCEACGHLESSFRTKSARRSFGGPARAQPRGRTRRPPLSAAVCETAFSGRRSRDRGGARG